MTQRLTLFFISVFFTGCSFIDSQYQQPQLPIPKNWTKDETDKINKNLPNTHTITWENIVLDKKLKQIIRIALQHNRTLREEMANVESLKATYQIQNASKYPAIESQTSGTKSRSLNEAGSDNQNSASFSKSYNTSLKISSYELDFWGKAKNLSEADFESYLSAKEAQRVSKITIISEVANAWITIATDRSLLNLAEKTAKSGKENYLLVQARFNMGVDSEIALNDAKTIYYQALTDVHSYKTLVAQDINALNLLVGESIKKELLPSKLNTYASYFAVVPVGLPSEVLLNRPDIQEAEHDLKAAYANIGAARAAYFPSISLTTSAGLSSNALQNLFTGGATSTWSFAPTISLPIFDWGANKASLEYAKSQKNLYVAKYELAIQTAFSEVADALARYATIEDQLDAQNNLVAAAAKSFSLSQKRYALGADSYSDTLTAQRTLYSEQQTLISLYLTKINNRITLYRVLAQEE